MTHPKNNVQHSLRQSRGRSLSSAPKARSGNMIVFIAIRIGAANLPTGKSFGV